MSGRAPVEIEDLASLFAASVASASRTRRVKKRRLPISLSSSSSSSLKTLDSLGDSLGASRSGDTATHAAKATATKRGKKRLSSGVSKACAACARSHLSCDGGRPCGRCRSKHLDCEERVSKADMRSQLRKDRGSTDALLAERPKRLPTLLPVGWMPWMLPPGQAPLMVHAPSPFILPVVPQIPPFDSSSQTLTAGPSSTGGSTTLWDGSLPSMQHPASSSVSMSGLSSTQSQRPLQVSKPIVAPRTPPLANLVYPPEKILHCAASSQNPKCRSCKANIVQVPKTSFSSTFTNENPVAVNNVEQAHQQVDTPPPMDLEQLIRDSMGLPDCFSFLDSFLQNEITKPLPLWMSGVPLTHEAKTQILDCESRISLALSLDPRARSNSSDRTQLPSVAACIQDYSRAFLMMNSPAGLWSIPDGFLRLSNASFTSQCSKDLIQLCVDPSSLEDLYNLMETCVSRGSATGQLLLVQYVKAAVSLSLVWTAQGPLVVGYFIPL